MEVLYLPECLFVLLLMRMLFCNAVVVNVVAVLGIIFTAVSYRKIGWRWLVPSQSFMSKLWPLHKLRTTYCLKFFIFFIFRAYLRHFSQIFPTDFVEIDKGDISRDGEGPQGTNDAIFSLSLSFERIIAWNFHFS